MLQLDAGAIPAPIPKLDPVPTIEPTIEPAVPEPLATPTASAANADGADAAGGKAKEGDALKVFQNLIRYLGLVFYFRTTFLYVLS